MESFLPLSNLGSRNGSRRGVRSRGRSHGGAVAAQFSLQQLEDRTVMSSSIQLSGTGWKPIGPGVIENTTAAIPTLTSAGRVNQIAHAPVPFDPSNPGYTGPTDPADPTFELWNTYYAALPGGGVAKTIDGGRNWKFLIDNLPSSSWANVDANRTLSVGAVGVSPFNRNLILAGTGTNYGDSFPTIGIPSGSGQALIYDNGYDFTGHGVLRSTDGGTNWALFKGPGGVFEGKGFTKFVYHPTDPGTVYAVVNGGRSTHSTNGAGQPAVLFGATSGVFRSTDGGQTWADITGNISGGPSFDNITDFILDPTSPNVGYVGVQDYGVVRTANLQVGNAYTAPAAINYTLTLGGTGTQLAGGSFGHIRLAFGLGTPSQPSRIYALTTSFADLFNVAPVGPRPLGGQATQLFRSDDSGINYRRLDPFPGVGAGSTATGIASEFGIYNLTLVADPTSPARIFVGGRGNGSIQVLTNADYDPDDINQTPNWINLTIPPGPGDQFTTIRDIGFDNTGAKDVNGRALNPGRLLLATDSGVYRFEAPNAATTTITNFLGNSLAFSNLNGNVGATALNAQQVFSTGLFPRDDNRVLAGTYLNGTTYFQDGGPFAPTDPNYPGLFGWEPSTVGNGGNIVVNQLNANNVYRVTNYSPYATTQGPLFQRSTDRGLTFTTPDLSGIVNADITARNVPLEVDPSPLVGSQNARLYLGTNQINVSDNDGQNWAQLGPDLNFVKYPSGVNPRPRVTAISNSREFRYPIYVAVDLRVTPGPDATPRTYEGPAIYRWDGPPSNAWIDVSPGVVDGRLSPTPNAPALPQPNSMIGIVTDMVSDNTTPGGRFILYAVCDTPGEAGTGGKRIWRTTNGGFNWTDITGNLPASVGNLPGLRVYTIALDPNRLDLNPNSPGDPVNQRDDDLYIGTSLGVYKLTDPVNSTTWSRLYGSGGGAGSTGTDQVAGAMPDVMVRDVKLNTTTGVLSAATFGRGVWQTQIRPYIRGLVYEDITGNGVLDTAPASKTPDTKLPGAVIVANDIVPNPDVQFANTTAAANGEWVFRSLPASTYSFLPSDASTLYVDPASRFYFTSSPIVAAVDPSKTINNQDLFIFRRVSISGTVYEDNNGNGVRDAGENPGVGYAVTLVAPAKTLDPLNPTVIATVTTDANGNYTFLGVGPLRPDLVGPSTPFAEGYRVVLSKAGVQTTQTPGQTGALLSGVNFSDAKNESQTRIGAFRLGQISGTVFNDTNGDGALNGAELGSTLNWLLTLTDVATAKVVATVTSDAAGKYTFGDLVTGLTAGTYQVTVADKAGFARTTPIPPVTIISGTNSAGVNIGEFAAASITGVAFEDTNSDGIRQASETTTFAGVTISVLDPRTKAVVTSAVTDAAGVYTISGLFPLAIPGNKTPYLVEFTSPRGTYSQTILDPAVTLTSGGTATADVPLFVSTTVSGFAFEDANGNGLRDPGEGGLVGGSVSLLNSATGAVVYTTTTDAAGNFTFTGVGPIVGPIPFRVGANPVGFVQTTPNPPDFFVSSNTPVSGLALGLFRLATFSGVVFEDVNGNGLRDAGEPGVPGRTIQLVPSGNGAVIATTTSGTDGVYTIQAGAGDLAVRLAPQPGFVQTTADLAFRRTTSGLAVTGQDFGTFQLTTVTGRVFNDLNGNSILDNDPGLNNVTVQLVNVATGAVAATTTTDSTGFFLISGIGPGNYLVRVALPTGFVASTPATQNFTATSGTQSTFSFGVFLPVTVSGNVYEDLDRTNSFTPSDIASPGWTVQVVRPGGIVVGTFLTDAAGNFAIPNVAPGNYTVRVLNRQGWVVLNNGSQSVTVTSGTALTVARVGVLKLGAISGSVYLDSNRNNRRDGFERGLPDGVVALIDANGTQVSTQTADANGSYTFFGLQTGAYTVRLLNPPSGFASTGGVSSINAAVTVGSNSASNTVAGVDFGLLGRRRYALAADGGGGPRVQVYDALNNQQIRDFFVYEVTFTGGVRVASADVNGDGIDDLVVVPGVGGGPRVRVLSGVDGAEIYNYFAYEPSFTDGLYVTASDVNGDGFADIITGTGAGGGPRVTVFSGKTGTIIADYFAYNSDFRGGVRVGSGDVNGDGVAEVITTPGIGGDSNVRVWAGGSFKLQSSFNAFDPSYTGGTFIAGGTANPFTGRADIIITTGVGYPGAPIVRVYDGLSLAPKAEFEAFPSGNSPDQFTSEVRAASFDRNGDNVPDYAVVSGSGSVPRLRFVDGVNFRQIGDERQPYESAFLGGIFIG